MGSARERIKKKQREILKIQASLTAHWHDKGADWLGKEFQPIDFKQKHLGVTQSTCLWAGAGPPGGTVRRAAVRKRGSGSMSLYEHRLPD